MKKFISILIILMMITSLIFQSYAVNLPVEEIVANNSQPINAGYFYSMVIKPDGSLWSWGRNYDGELGDGTKEDSLLPKKIMDEVVASAGAMHSMVIKRDSSLWAWGNNAFGQLGDGTREESLTPKKIMEDIIAVSVSNAHTLAIKSDGSLWAWGDNVYGQLGDGTSEDSLIPKKIMEDVIAVSAGYWHSLAIKRDGSLWSWGDNSFGQLGVGTTVDTLTGDSLSPRKVMEDVIAVSAGFWHSIALKRDGSFWAWGDNDSGQLGDGLYEASLRPKKIIEDVIAISAGAYHSMALKGDGSLWSWGYNNSGQLGDGTIEYRMVPIKVMNGDTSPYVYNQMPEDIQLPTDKLTEIKDETTANKVVKEVVQALTAEEKETGVDTITLFAEEAIAQAAVHETGEESIVINNEIVKEIEEKATRTLETIEKTLKDNNVELQREIQENVKVRTSSENKITVTVDDTVKNSSVDNIIVENPSFSLTITKNVIEKDTEEPLMITIEEIEEGVEVASRNILYASVPGSGSSKTYKVEFNRAKTNENIKISLPPVSGETKYQAVLKNNTAVGGKYNPITNKIEAKISTPGNYIVKQNEKDFSDIKNKPAEMQEAIKILASKGIINGNSPTTFNPDGSISRAEIAALIMRTLSKVDPNANGGFTDVKTTDWYYGAIGSAKRDGIINGLSATTFGPKQQIQKGQIVAIASRTLRSEMGYKLPTDIERYNSIYADKTTFADWMKSEVAMATRENLIVKRTDNKFLPTENMTRGDASIILYRMFNKLW